MPDPPFEAAEQPGAPGQLTAASIRETWAEIVTMVGRKSKKIAALASGATVRDLDGQTVVLTFRFPAHARMVAAQPELLSDALYETLGGRWQIRCEVGGDGGGTPAPTRGGPPPPSPAPPQPTTPQQPAPRQAAPQQAAPQQAAPQQAAPQHGGAPPADDDWPEPARPASAPAPAPAPAPDDWPEPARPGGFAPAGGDSSVSRADGPGAAASVTSGAGVATASGVAASGAVAGATVGGSRTPAPAVGSGRAAARAAAAGGGVKVAAPSVSAWSDGSPAEEPPYDPDYDGPVRPSGSGGGPVKSIEGFDPGDEPLDDVIDEKTARQSSEQQAMQLLQEAFGAEKIGES